MFSSPTIERSQERRWLILGVLCISLVVVVVGNVALNIALPRISEDLDASFTSLQWMVDAYGLLFAGLLLFAGALGDRFGRKGALQGGLAAFGIASVAASFATESWQIIAARAVMGIAAAFIMPGTLSILAAVFPPRERPRAIAIWAGVAGASVAIGMVWSGLLLERFWWGSVFLTNGPIVAIALILGVFLLPKSCDPTQAPLDRGGAALSIAMLTALLYALIEGPVKGWSEPLILGAFAVSVVLLGVFVWWERRVDDPMLDLSFFDDPRFTIGCITILVAFLGLFGTYFLLTQYLQEVRGYSPLQAGLYTLPAGVSQLVAAPVSARLVERWGYRPILATGLGSVAAGMAVLAFLTVSTPVWLLAVGLVLLGAGLGLSTPPATGAIIAALPLRKAGVGSAVNDTTRELGGAIGIALLGSLLTSRFRSAVRPAVESLPASLRSSVGEGISPALQVARNPRVASASPRLAATARDAFTGGFLVACLVAAAIAALGAVLVLRAMPRDLRPHGHGEVETDDVEVRQAA